MRRRAFLGSTALAAAWAALGPRVDGADVIEMAVGQLEPLRRGVGIFADRGGTIGWLVNDGGAVVVDTQFPASAEKALAAFRARAALPLAAVINTHHHRDHVGGNAVFRPEAARIVAHASVPGSQRRAAMAAGGADGQVYADTTFEDTWSTEIGDEVVSLKWWGRAHTFGDITVHFERAGIVHLGDLVFQKFPPVVDRNGGSDLLGWMAVLERIHAAFGDETSFIFGHGTRITGSRADLLVMRDFLGDLREYARAGVEAGKPVEELLAERLPGHPDVFRPTWVEAMPNAIRAAYADVKDGPVPVPPADA